MKGYTTPLIVIGVALLGVVGYSTLQFLSPGVAVEAARVERGDISEFVEERGKTRLPREYLITMPYAGRIESVALDEGDPVTAGQIVAQVTPLDLDLDVRAAQAAVDRLDASIYESDDVTVETTGLAQAREYVESMDSTVAAARENVTAEKARLDYSNKNYERIARLARTGAKTEDDLDRARLDQVESDVEYRQSQLMLSAVESIQAATMLLPTSVQQYITRKGLGSDVYRKQKTEAEIELEQVRRNQSLGAMSSPIDGVVLERPISNARYLAAGEVLLKIGRLDQLQVEVDVLSQDVVRVKEGDRVDLYGPTIGTDPVAGLVSRIFPAGFTKISSLGVEQQRVRVIVDFDSAVLARLRDERKLGVGYRVLARIYTAEATDANFVPRAALFRGAAGDWQVYAIRDGRARLAGVKVGLVNDNQAQILDGLTATDVVILAPETNLVDGAKVSPIMHGAETNSTDAD